MKLNVSKSVMVLLENTHKKLIAYRGTTNQGLNFKRYRYTYFSMDYEYAKKFAESAGQVIKAEISYHNPFIIEAKYMGHGEIVLNNEIIGFYRDLQSDAVKKLKNEGYDIIVVNYNGIKGLEVIPFDDGQINVINNNFKPF